MSNLAEAMKIFAKENAQHLKEQGEGMSGTEIIDQEIFVPEWKPANYQTVGAPIRYGGQVYKVLQVHDSTSNPDWTPAATPALWSICHTTDPAKAKPWLEPQGTSGMYQLGECYRADDGTIYRQIYDGDNVYNAEAMPDRWQTVEVV